MGRLGQQTREDDLAKVALVVSLLALMGCLPVGVVGLAIGTRSRDRIRSSDGALTGEPIARAAIVISWIGITISLLAMLAFVVAAAIRRST